MKNKIHALLICMAMIGVLIFPNYAIAEDETDQYCDDSQISNATNPLSLTTNSLRQIFRPATTTMSGLGLAISMGIDNNKPVTAHMYQIAGGVDLDIATLTTTGTSQLITWVSFNVDNVTMDTTKDYYFDVSTTSSTALWYYSNGSCYSGGEAVINGTHHPDKDFGFYTLGHGTPTSGGTTSETSDEIVSTILKPTNVKAEYDANTNKEKLAGQKRKQLILTATIFIVQKRKAKIILNLEKPILKHTSI